MLQLRFFASIREQLGCAGLSLSCPPDVESVEQLVRVLDRETLPGCARWLLAENTIVARNRTVVSRGEAVSDGDEIAFFPPVTGG